MATNARGPEALVLAALLMLGGGAAAQAQTPATPDAAPPAAAATPPAVAAPSPAVNGAAAACGAPDPNDRDAPIPLCRYSQYRSPATGQFKVKNGSKAEPKDYPALFYFLGSGGICTASLVADQTMVTAAHCVRDGGKLTTPIATFSNQTATGVCRHAVPDADTPRLDLALCKLDKRLAGPFERLNRDPALLIAGPGKPAVKVLLVGFGCGADNEPKPETPVFRDGTTTIEKVEAGAIHTKGGAAVCLGDSGGPAFLKLSGGKRVQVAVNSQEAGGEESWLASTSSKAAISFIDGWAAPNDQNQRICGFHPHALNCS